MKKSLLFLAAAAAVSMNAFAATELEEGTEYYFRNVKTGMWLNGGYSWGTKGVLKDQARAFELFDGDGYGAFKMKSTCQQYDEFGEVKHDGGEIYIDGGIGSGAEWFIELQSNGHFTIDDGGWYLCPESDNLMTYGDAVDDGIMEGSWESGLGALHSYNFYPISGTTSYSLDNDAIMWDIFTREELVAELQANANAENPMDATFLIKAHMIDRNDHENATAWKVTKGGTPGELVFPDFGWGFHIEGYTEWAIAGTYAWFISEELSADEEDVVSQEVSGAPAGVYEVKYRVVDQTNTPFSLTFNDTQADVTDGGDWDLWYTHATRLLADRTQIKTAKFEVGEDGKLAITMTKQAKAGEQNRFAFKSFILSYLGSDDGSGVETVATDAADAPAEYFNLQGIRVAEPTNGIYIVKQGNKVSKQVVR